MKGQNVGQRSKEKDQDAEKSRDVTKVRDAKAKVPAEVANKGEEEAGNMLAFKQIGKSNF